MKSGIPFNQRQIVLAAGAFLLAYSMGPLPFLHGELPKTFPIRRELQEQAVQKVSSVREKEWNLICWHDPVLLIQELEEVGKFPELKPWSDSVHTLIQALSKTFPYSESTVLSEPRLGNGKLLRAVRSRGENGTSLEEWDLQDPSGIAEVRRELLKQLAQKVHEARSLQQQLSDRDPLVLLVRTNYTLQRRIILWNYCAMLLAPENVEVSSRISQVPEAEWKHLLQEAEKLVNAHPYQSTWRSYLRLNTLAQIEKYAPQRQREIAWQVLGRLDSRALDDSQRAFLAQEPFLKLKEALKGLGAQRTPEDCLMRDVEAYESGGDVACGNRIVMEVRREEMERGEKLAPEWRSLEFVYRNANMRLEVSEKFLNSSLPQPGSEERNIRESVLNRPVYGRSTTQTAVSVRMVPDENLFRLGFLVEGTMSSSTYSPDVVTVYNKSNAQYTAFKEVRFSEDGLELFPAVAEVESQVRIRDLETPLDPIPVIGFFANGVARNQAESRKGEVNQFTENKIRREVCTQLDTQVNEKLGQANAFLRDQFLASLGRLELSLDQIDAQTTESGAAIRFRLAGDMHPGSFTPRPVPPKESQVNLQLHESTLNNFLQHLSLDGRTFTIESLCEHIQVRFPNLKIGENIPPQEEELLITFADSNAVTVHFQDGRFLIRVAVKDLRVGKRQWKNFQVETPYLVETGEKAVLIQRDGPVRLIGRIPIGQQVAVRGIFSKIFKKTEGKNILPERFVTDPRFANLVLDQLVLQDGWFAISFGPQNVSVVSR